MNDNNLIPNRARSPDKLREMGRKGGLASGRSRRKKRDLQKLVKSFLFPDAKKLPEGMLQNVEHRTKPERTRET